MPLQPNFHDNDRYSETTVPVTLTGKKDPSRNFRGVIIGMTPDGFGFRSDDDDLGNASLEEILRQPYECNIHLEGSLFDEILCRITRVEACRHDPRYRYFGVAQYLQITDVDEISIQTGVKLYSSKRPRRPLVSKPPPPKPRTE